MSSYRNDTRYVRQREDLKRAYKAQGMGCVSCGEPFLWDMEDRTLFPDFWKDARSFTADHLTAVNVGGRMAPGVDGLQGMHRACNSSKGDGSKNRRPKPPPDAGPLRTSRQW